ncbi:BTAD domain-containing putative transcriptional regulator [Streptomyces sp. NPDC015184]|uniref:AfsR/SARP family transcriptional regulator n=1 Tax=Streptomyces sp. NPDC015184 TaxID=3364946 RepID=UPI0036F8A94A
MEFRLLGEVGARTDTGPVELGPARQRTVLAALLMTANRPVTVDRLADRVWGDGPPQRATQTLYSYVSRLRRLLPGVITRGQGGGYVLTADESAVDVHRFRQLLGPARQCDDDARAVTLFRQALELWRGEPFPGVDTPWFNATRETLRKEQWAAELDCTDLRLRTGEHTALLTPLSERSAAHPLDERLAAQYMLAAYRCGRQADALAHYRHLRDMLAEELGIDPGPELQRLHRAMLGGPEPVPPPAPNGNSHRHRTQSGRVPLDPPVPTAAGPTGVRRTHRNGPAHRGGTDRPCRRTGRRVRLSRRRQEHARRAPRPPAAYRFPRRPVVRAPGGQQRPAA